MTEAEPVSTTRAAVAMGAITAVSRLLGFIRVLVVAAVLGTTYLGNAFQAANSLSNVLFELLAAGALSAVLVPTFVELLDRGDERGAEEVAGGILGVALVALGAITAVALVAAPLIARGLTAGVPSEVAHDQRELITYLLRFFLPQVLFYAAGTVAIAVLYAKRRFAVTAAAPIGNTVVMVACLVVFRWSTGSGPGLDLTGSERLLLAAAGTGGVLAFVGVLLIAARAARFRLRPRWPRGDARVATVLRTSAWGVVLHAGGGLLLGAAIVAGSATEGGVVAYQVAWVIFLAPYAVLAQPIHTAILPELVAEARDSGLHAFAASVRWALERMIVVVVPVAAVMAALALPAMRAVAFGETRGAGVEMLAAAVATLAIGLLPYSAFLLLVRAFYALGDSRTPGVVAIGTALVGVATMVVAALASDGVALIALLGGAHSVSYTLATLVLGARLAQRVGASLVPKGLARVGVVGAIAGLAAWSVEQVASSGDPSRARDAGLVAGAAAVGAVLVLAGYRAAGVRAALSARRPAEATP